MSPERPLDQSALLEKLQEIEGLTTQTPEQLLRMSENDLRALYGRASGLFREFYQGLDSALGEKFLRIYQRQMGDLVDAIRVAVRDTLIVMRVERGLAVSVLEYHLDSTTQADVPFPEDPEQKRFAEKTSITAMREQAVFSRSQLIRAIQEAGN